MVKIIPILTKKIAILQQKLSMHFSWIFLITRPCPVLVHGLGPGPIPTLFLVLGPGSSPISDPDLGPVPAIFMVPLLGQDTVPLKISGPVTVLTALSQICCTLK